MKRTTVRVTAAAVAAMMAMASLSGCGVMSSASKEVTTQSTTSTQQDSKEIHDLVLAHLASTEISTFNLLNSQTRADVQYLTNMLDGMVEVDSYGNIVPGIATDWTTEDGGKTWTFHLRDNVTWVDVNGNEKAKLTADDFMTGMEWVLNFHKNDSANVSMPSDMIQGAKEYYEYTKNLSKEQAYQLTAEDGSKFREMVGIETPDDYTLVYHCTAAKPYFDTVMAKAYNKNPSKTNYRLMRFGMWSEGEGKWVFNLLRNIEVPVGTALPEFNGDNFKIDFRGFHINVGGTDITEEQLSTK